MDWGGYNNEEQLNSLEMFYGWAARETHKFFRDMPTAGLNYGRISSVVRALAAEREVAGSIPGAGPILRVLK